jgi:hypothetical protein
MVGIFYRPNLVKLHRIYHRNAKKLFIPAINDWGIIMYNKGNEESVTTSHGRDLHEKEKTRQDQTGWISPRWNESRYPARGLRGRR